MTPPRRGIVVIGIGNIIRSDDGLGVHAVQRLRERLALAEGVELIEGGTAGLLLLPDLAGASRAIIIDAIDTGAAPGTLTRLPNGEGAFAGGMTPHDVGLADLLTAARLSDAWPDVLVLHGAQPGSTAMGTELTPPVAAALDGLVAAVEAELLGSGGRSLHRHEGAQREGRNRANEHDQADP
jgi:hydrogenase maturation protease